MERIGLIAGGGRLPIIFAEEARKKGAKVIGFAVKGMASPDFDAACDRAHRFNIGEVKKFFFLLLAERIKKVAMLGKIDKTFIYSRNLKVDAKGAKFLNDPKAKNDYSLLDRVTAEFKKFGVEVIDGVEYLSHLLPAKGVLTEKAPSENEKKDIEFGIAIARKIAGMDIGQTIVVKDRSVMAVEAAEGTDRTIQRAAELCTDRFVVIKVPRPEQDMRWDVPVVGPETVSLIAENRGSALALEEKKMFLIDKPACLNIANENNISIVVV